MLCSERRSQHLSLVDMQGCAHLIFHAQLLHKYAARENEEQPATLPVLRASHKAQKIRDVGTIAMVLSHSLFKEK